MDNSRSQSLHPNPTLRSDILSHAVGARLIEPHIFHSHIQCFAFCTIIPFISLSVFCILHTLIVFHFLHSKFILRAFTTLKTTFRRDILSHVVLARLIVSPISSRFTCARFGNGPLIRIGQLSTSLVFIFLIAHFVVTFCHTIC